MLTSSAGTAPAREARDRTSSNPEDAAGPPVTTWEPDLYLAYSGPRARPALDLLARIPAEAPARVHDLGCGAGNVTRLLSTRWPGARLVGIDSSAEMLLAAAAEMPEGTWIEADLGTWTPEEPADVLFSNAVLHWLGDHEELFPRLLGWLAPGGVLAVQMPANFDAPSHTGIAMTAREAPWRERLEPLLGPPPVAPPAEYYELLAPRCRTLDIWETTYLHVLEGEDAVLNWVKGTALRPLLAALDEADRPAFEAACAARLLKAYPPRPDGRTLFPFRRLFIVAGV